MRTNAHNPAQNNSHQLQIGSPEEASESGMMSYAPPPLQLMASAADAPTDSNAPLQLLGRIRFTNLDKGNMEMVDKADTVRKQLLASNEITQYLQTRDCILRLANPGLPNTPAEVVECGGQVQVNLAPWYFEQVTVGEIIGMLAHEFAVHPMAEWRLNAADKQNENQQVQGGEKMNSGYKTIFNHKLSKDEDNQKDHLFMAKKDEPRAQYYRKVTYELVAGLWEESESEHPEVTEEDVKRAVISYQGDVAMTVLTNDHKPQFQESMSNYALLPFVIKQVMNYWRNECDSDLNQERGRAIWNLSKEWKMGVAQAKHFIELYEARGQFNPQAVDNNEQFINGLSANQLETRRDMGWDAFPTRLLTDGQAISEFYTVCTLGSAEAQPEVAIANEDLPDNWGGGDQPLLNAIAHPGLMPWPNQISEVGIRHLGAALGLSIFVLRHNGTLDHVTAGDSKIVVAETQAGEFALVFVQ